MSATKQIPTRDECSHPPESREVCIGRKNNGEVTAVDFCNDCLGYV